MYKVDTQNTIVTLLDDIGFTKYTRRDGSEQIVYMPKDAFVKNIYTLKNAPVNFEHTDKYIQRGVVRDVVQNLKGITTYTGEELPADSEYYAVLEIHDGFFEEAQKFKAISTEYVHDESVTKDELTTHILTKHIVDEDGTIDGFVPDIYCVKPLYDGIALTNIPKRTRLKDKVFNSREKNLDNTRNANKMNKVFIVPMEITPENLKSLIKEVLDETLSQSVENALASYEGKKQEDNSSNEKDKTKDNAGEENSALAEKIDVLAQTIADLKGMVEESSKKNSTDKEQEGEDNACEQGDKPKEQNSANSFSQAFNKDTKQKEQNSGTGDYAGENFFQLLSNKK